MAAGQATTRTSTIVPILHLVFTIVSIAVLSYKVYHVESELSFIRDELSTHDRSDGFTKMLSLSTTAPISEHSRSESRSDRNRRRNHRDHEESAASRPNQKKPETTSTKKNIDADCLQRAIKNFQVCTSHSRVFATRSCCLFCLVWK